MIPRVTVAMPVYNGERFIKESIKSVLNQTFKDFELLIIDDGSTDTTSEIINAFPDKRIRYIRNPKNTGLGNVRNQAVKEARGEYIAWNDADDISVSTRLNKQVSFLDKHPDFGLLGAWVEIIDEKSKPAGIEWKDNITAEEMPIALLFHNRFAQSSVVLRKSVLPLEPYRQEYAPTEDYDLWLRLVGKNKAKNFPEILLEYREHSGGQSKLKSGNKENSVKMLITEQINKLGIKPNEDELAIHRTNYVYTGENLMGFISKREHWLSRLVEANDKMDRYDKENFRKFIGHTWLISCSSNIKKNPKIKKTFWLSPLSKNFSLQKDWKQFAKLIFG